MDRGPFQMSVSDIFNRGKLARLITVARQEGWRTAAARARRYLSDRLRGGRIGRDEAYLDRFWQDMARRGGFHVGQAPALLTGTRRIAMIGDLYLPQCHKYRVAQPAELWAGAGVDYTYSDYRDVPRSVAAMQNATHLMFYRTLNDPVMAMYLYEARRLRLPVAYDLDDPLFSISAYETYENMKALPAAMKAHFLAEAPKYLGAMNQADIVTVSTPGMAEHTRAYTTRPVHFRRNFADAETLAAAEAALMAAPPREGAPFRVGFASGSMGHEIDFALIADDIGAFLAADATRQLVILGHFDEKLLPEALRGRVQAHPFTTYEKYLDVLATLDCAVMPLTDDAFNRCKSAVRVIDAAAVAVPSLVGQVGDMAHMVQDGVTGRVLGAGASWRAALEEIATTPGAAAALGQAARKDLLATWTARLDLPVIEPELVAWVKG